MTRDEAIATLKPWLPKRPVKDAVPQETLEEMVEAVAAARAGRPWVRGRTTQYWDKDCHLHRLDGPALIEGHKFYFFIHGVEFDPQEHGIKVRPDGTFATPAHQVMFSDLGQVHEDGTPDHDGEVSMLVYTLYGE